MTIPVCLDEEKSDIADLSAALVREKPSNYVVKVLSVAVHIVLRILKLSFF